MKIDIFLMKNMSGEWRKKRETRNVGTGAATSFYERNILEVHVERKACRWNVLSNAELRMYVNG